MEKTKKRGRPQKEINEDFFKIVCEEWQKGNITAANAMRKLGLPKVTFYKKAKERGYAAPGNFKIAERTT